MIKGDILIERFSWLDDVVLDFLNLEEDMPSEVKHVLEDLVNQWPNTLKHQLFDEMALKHGEQLLMAALNMITYSNCSRGWIAHREQADHNDYETFYDILWRDLPDEGFEFTSDYKEGKVYFHVTKCPLAELAIELGIEKWIYPLTCGTDPIAIASFNPDIGFERDKTLMEGHAYCNHTYILKS